MSARFIAVVGCTLSISGATPGTATITGSPSTKVSAGGQKVYRGSTAVQVVGCSSGNFVQTAPATGNFSPTATKVKADGQFVLRVDDSVTIFGVVLTDPGSGSTITVNITVQISAAGQTKVKAG